MSITPQTKLNQTITKCKVCKARYPTLLQGTWQSSEVEGDTWASIGTVPPTAWHWVNTQWLFPLKMTQMMRKRRKLIFALRAPMICTQITISVKLPCHLTCAFSSGESPGGHHLGPWEGLSAAAVAICRRCQSCSTLGVWEFMLSLFSCTPEAKGNWKNSLLSGQTIPKLAKLLWQ